MTRGGVAGRAGLAAVAVAMLATGALGLSPPARAQAPISVPAARFYGVAKDSLGQPVDKESITAGANGVTCSGTESGVRNAPSVSQTDDLGNYVLDVQAVPGCATPGTKITFTTGSPSRTAQEKGTIPDLPGTAIHLDLTFPGRAAATPTRAPVVRTPPPPPTVARTVAPTAVRPVPTAVRPVPTVARPVPTAVRPAAQGPRAQGPAKGPVRAQGPKAAQAPRAAARVGAGGAAAAPRLPSTGTGGLLDQQSSSSGMAGWALAMILLSALGLGATGLVTYRRSQ